MTIDDYQDKAYSTALPNCQNANYMLLGLVNEVGEAAGVVKKWLRGDLSEFEMYEKLNKELGDTFWYLGGLATTLEMRLDDIAQTNLSKLADRKARGVLQGSGDDR